MKISGLVLAISLVSAVALNAQVTITPLTDDDIKLIRQDIQGAKDGIITNTMEFTDAEGQAFWPVYKEYAAEQRKIAERRFGVIVDYLQKVDKLTDADASSLTNRLLQVEDEAQALRKAYFPKFEGALGPKRAAKFYQVDNRLTMILNVQLASAVPVIP